jgi:hypothetical protein
MPSPRTPRTTAMRASAYLAAGALSAALCTAVATPAEAAKRWTFYDTTPGCSNAVREISVAPSGPPKIKRVVVKAARGHQLTPLDTRGKRLLYSDYNCQTERTAIRLAELDKRVTKYTIQESADPLRATFDHAGRNIIIGRAASLTAAELTTYSARTLAPASSRTIATSGYLWDLDSGTGGATYLALSRGLGQDRRTALTPLQGDTLGAPRVTATGTTPRFDVSRSEDATYGNETSGTIRIHPDALNRLPKRTVNVCGNTGIQNVTWLARNVVLTTCGYQRGYTHYLVDMRGDKVRKRPLGRIGTPGAAGINALGKG